MKVLLRKFDGAEFTWMDATFNSKFFVVNGREVSETNVVSIHEDNRNEYVKCSACGKILKKDSPEIEEHRNRYKDTSNCMTCRYVNRSRIGDSTRRYEHISDADYRVIIEEVNRMRCTRGCWWAYPEIGTEEAQNNCMHKKCADAEYSELEDIFTRNPGIFDDIITVDKVIEVGYKSAYSMYNGITRYKLNGRNQIEAQVNNTGIVDYFIVAYGRNDWNIAYSKKLDKLFDMRDGVYREWNPTELTDNTKNYIKARIAELYN